MYLNSLTEQELIEETTTEFFLSRYIPSDILEIAHQTDIYNDVVAYYNWYEGDVFGVEIMNAKIAKQQRQMFEIIWQMAKPLSHKNDNS